jgi:acetyl esterase/lipase
MKRSFFFYCGAVAAILLLAKGGIAQSPQPPDIVKNIFSPQTIVYPNIAYAGDTSRKHLLDIYLPADAKKNTPLVVWIHGGAWMLNDKYADMGYMAKTVRGFLDQGYALASIDYRYSTEAVFPAQIQDCNQAVEFLYQHAETYKLDKDRIALIGFSAGGHLASLMGLSNNNAVKEFYPPSGPTHFSIRCVLDFYGPADFTMFASNPDPTMSNAQNPIAILLGALPGDRPDLAKKASPVTYVDKNDPPFLIVQGEMDETVPNTQSKKLYSRLKQASVKSELIIVPNAPHYGVMFDTDDIRQKLFAKLRENMK